MCSIELFIVLLINFFYKFLLSRTPNILNPYRRGSKVHMVSKQDDLTLFDSVPYDDLPQDVGAFFFGLHTH